VRGASGVLDEVDEARRVVEHLADELELRGVVTKVFHDDISTSQNENLDRIVDYHNAQMRDLDISVHFNADAHEGNTTEPIGTEVLFVTQAALADKVSAAIASCGLKDRGGKEKGDLYFLNNTNMPAILIEVCFVDSEADADIYGEHFDAICSAIADVIGGEKEEVTEPPTTQPPADVPRVDIQVSGEVMIYVNGTQIGTKG
jgi:N-acetylmuramoyl-L-alanine amidase